MIWKLLHHLKHPNGSGPCNTAVIRLVVAAVTWLLHCNSVARLAVASVGYLCHTSHFQLCITSSLPRGSVSSGGEGEGRGEGVSRRRSRQRPASSPHCNPPHAPALELPPRGGGGSNPPPRPPDYYTQVLLAFFVLLLCSISYLLPPTSYLLFLPQLLQGSSQGGRGSRVSRTQSRDSGGREEEETQVSAV